MATRDQLGTDAILTDAQKQYNKEHRMDNAKKSANAVKEKMNAIAEKESERYNAHPVLHPMRNMLIMKGVQYGAPAAISAAAVTAPVVYVNHRMNKNFKQEFNGMGMMKYAKEYKKGYKKAVKAGNMAFETDKDFGLTEMKFGEYTGIKLQKDSENWRTTVLSWFDADDEAQRLNDRDNDIRRHEAHMAFEREKAEEEMRRRKEEMRKMAIPMMASEFFRNPMIIRHLAGLNSNAAPNMAGYENDFFNNAAPFTQAEAMPQENTAKPQSAPVMKDVTPNQADTTEPIIYGNAPEAKPLLGAGNQVVSPLPEFCDDYQVVQMSPQVLEAYTSMQGEFAQNSPLYAQAALRQRTDWYGLPDGTLVEDLQTLQSAMYLQYMMANMADGSITTMNDMEWYQNRFTDHWTEFEQTALMPKYGDRIKAFYESKNKTPSKAEQIMIDSNEHKYQAIERGTEPKIAIESARKESSVGLGRYAAKTIADVFAEAAARHQFEEKETIPVAIEQKGKAIALPDNSMKENEMPVVAVNSLPEKTNDMPVVSVNALPDKSGGMPVVIRPNEAKVEDKDKSVVVEAGEDETTDDKVETTKVGSEKKKEHRKVPAGIAAIASEARNLDKASNYVDAVRNRDEMKDVPAVNEVTKDSGMQM